MSISSRTDHSSSSHASSSKKAAAPAKVPLPPARPKQEKPAAPGDKVEVKKESQASPGAQSMAAGLAQNFGTKATGAAADSAKTGDAGKIDPGQGAVDDARKFLGSKSQDVKGKLDNFQAAGGNTNNCADFVSANLINRGLLKGKQVNVDKLRQQLTREGWSAVEAGDAKPGDVAFYKSKRHVELVSEAGGTKSIGSNNEDPITREPVAGQQYITERDMDPAQVTYYHRPEKTN